MAEQAVYTVKDIVDASSKIFKSEKYNANLVSAALKLSGKTSFTQAEAVKIVNDFVGSNSKGTATVTVKTETFSAEEIIEASSVLFKDKGYKPSLVSAALDMDKRYTKAEAINAVVAFAEKKISN